MKIFASVDTFVETASKSLMIGRLVANFEFLKALLSYGTFDQYHLFCPALENQQLLKQRLEATLDRQTLSRVVLTHHLNLPYALAQNDYAAFHLGDWFCYLPPMATLRATYSRTPFPLTGPIHSLHGADEARKAAELLRAPLRPGDAIICTSQDGRTVFQKLLHIAREAAGASRDALEPRLEVLPLGVPTAAFDQLDPKTCRMEMGLPAESICFLYLGRISISSKGDLVPLLYTFRLLLEDLREGPPLCLVIAGSAGETELTNLKREIRRLELEANVILRPDVEDADKQRLLCGSDVFLSPVDNLQETFGISVVEAMAAGLPTLVTDYDGYRDLVVEGETGFRIPTLWRRPPETFLNLRSILEQKVVGLTLGQSFVIDQEILRDRMRLLALDSELRLRLGDAGRRRAQERFAWERIIPSYEALWDVLKAEAVQGAASPWPPPPRHSASYLFEVFEHYPTAMLKDDDYLALTDLTERILAGTMPMPPTYEEIALLLPEESLGPLIASLQQQVLPWGRLRQWLASSVQASEDLLDFQILWLLKHGLLRVVAPTVE